MKIDTSIWENKERMQSRIKNLGTMILSLSAMNMLALVATKQWIVAGINALFFITTLPIFMSWAKYEKEPPKGE